MRFIVLFLLLLASQVATAQAPAGNLSKERIKVDKLLSKYFEKAVWGKSEIFVDEKLIVKHKLLSNKIVLFSLTKNGEAAGYALIASSMGRMEPFRYLVIYSLDKTVSEVNIFGYQSSYGSEITSPGWLRQFRGYSGKAIMPGKDIQAISGATYSVNSFTTDIVKLTTFVREEM